MYFRKPRNTQPNTSTTQIAYILKGMQSSIFLAEYYQVYNDDEFKTN